MAGRMQDAGIANSDAVKQAQAEKTKRDEEDARWQNACAFNARHKKLHHWHKINDEIPPNPRDDLDLQISSAPHDLGKKGPGVYKSTDDSIKFTLIYDNGKLSANPKNDPWTMAGYLARTRAMIEFLGANGFTTVDIDLHGVQVPDGFHNKTALTDLYVKQITAAIALAREYGLEYSIGPEAQKFLDNAPFTAPAAQKEVIEGIVRTEAQRKDAKDAMDIYRHATTPPTVNADGTLEHNEPGVIQKKLGKFTEQLGELSKQEALSADDTKLYNKGIRFKVEESLDELNGHTRQTMEANVIYLFKDNNELKAKRVLVDLANSANNRIQDLNIRDITTRLNQAEIDSVFKPGLSQTDRLTGLAAGDNKIAKAICEGLGIDVAQDANKLAADLTKPEASDSNAQLAAMKTEFKRVGDGIDLLGKQQQELHSEIERLNAMSANIDKILKNGKLDQIVEERAFGKSILGKIKHTPEYKKFREEYNKLANASPEEKKLYVLNFLNGQASKATAALDTYREQMKIEQQALTAHLLVLQTRITNAQAKHGTENAARTPDNQRDEPKEIKAYTDEIQKFKQGLHKLDSDLTADLAACTDFNTSQADLQRTIQQQQGPLATI